MFRQPFCCLNLIVPIEPIFSILRELDIVGWISINKIICFKRYSIKAGICEVPVTQDCLVSLEVSFIVNRRVLSEWHIEFTAAIESTKAVIACTIQIVEERRGFLRGRFASSQQVVESLSVIVETGLIVAHFNRDVQTSL